MIVDCHGHYTTAPEGLWAWRKAQLAGLKNSSSKPEISDQEIRDSLEGAQLKIQRERGTDVTFFSPRAGSMEHHVGDAAVSAAWTRECNDLIHRVCSLYPANFVPVCQLPQSPLAPPANSIPELRRCVEQLGFIGCNLNPDPTGGYWTGKPVTDREWYPLYEVLCELDVPAMIHVAASCNPNFHGTGAHYLNADTSVFMQLLQADLFKDFPTLRFVIPHGGGAVPYHWGRYRGMSLEIPKRPLEGLLDNVFFDTCVYHQPGVELLTKVIPATNVLFGSEMIGAVRGKDPKTGQYFDDTKRYLDGCGFLSDEERHLIFSANARRVYPRLDAHLAAKGL